MKLYFGNTVTTITTVMVLALLGFIGYSVWSRASILYWGRRTAFLFAFGLVICCFAATRDGLDKTVQCAIDGSCAPGLFALVSIPTIIGCIGAFLILLGRDCNTDCQNAADAPVLVLSDVRRHRFKSCRDGSCAVPAPLNIELYLKAIPHNSKCRYGERGAAAARPKAQIILDVLSSILATQMPCRSRRSGA